MRYIHCQDTVMRIEKRLRSSSRKLFSVVQQDDESSLITLKRSSNADALRGLNDSECCSPFEVKWFVLREPHHFCGCPCLQFRSYQCASIRRCVCLCLMTFSTHTFLLIRRRHCPSFSLTTENILLETWIKVLYVKNSR